jgi:cbb3-type cytochrome c oxidase subunit III
VEEPKPDDRSEGRVKRRGLRDWRVLAALGAAVVLAGVFAVQQVHARGLYAKLLQTEGDAVVQDAALTRFAADQGKPVYDRACASCHGAALKGDRARGVPDLTDGDWLYGTGRVTDIERVALYGIRSGQPKSWNLASMPGFGQPKPSDTYNTPPLRPQEIDDVVQYLRLIEDKPADPAAAARGVKVYANTGQCFDCHANDGAGDEAIGAPNLTDDIWLYGDGSRQAVYDSIAYGRHGVCPGFSQRLKAGEVKALAVYLYTASHPPHPAGGQPRETPS